MAIEVRSIKCPNCGAAVSYDDNSKTVKCEFCGGVLDMTEVYGPKMDRERDDMQDKQIKQIMNSMNRTDTQRRDSDIKKTRKTILTVLAVMGGIYVGMMLLTGIASAIVVAVRVGEAKKSVTQATKTQEIDPFDKLDITYSGVSGRATARLSDANTYLVSHIEKKTTAMENLSNGDTVTVTYRDDSVADSNTTYKLTRTEKTFTVEGLDEYVSDISVVGDEDLETLKKNAVALAKSECETDLDSFLPGTFDICAIYSMIKKDYSDQVTVFVVAFDYNTDKGVKRGYYMAKYPDVTALADGSYRINYNPGTYIYSRESYFQGFSLTSGHSTWDATYADVYLNNKADWNVYENYKNDELIGD